MSEISNIIGKIMFSKHQLKNQLTQSLYLSMKSLITEDRCRDRPAAISNELLILKENNYKGVL